MKLGKEREAERFDNFKGGEKYLTAKMFYDGKVRILTDAILPPGGSIGLHTHEGSMEIIYILKGEGIALCNGEEEKLTPGDVHYCRDGESHTLMNKGTEDLVFFAVVPNTI